MQVKDATTGAFLANVAVTIVGESTFSGTTDAQGRINLGSLSVGSSAELTATLAGYSEFTQTYTIPESGGIFINMSPVIEVNKGLQHIYSNILYAAIINSLLKVSIAYLKPLLTCILIDMSLINFEPMQIRKYTYFIVY